MARSVRQRVWNRAVIQTRAAGLVLAIVLLAAASEAVAGPRLPARDQSQLDALHESQRDFLLGVAAQRRGDLEAASAAYRAAIEKDPRFVEATVNLARAHADLGDLDAADRWLDFAAAARPDYPGVAPVRGLVALRRGDLPRAIDELTLARRAYPRDGELLVNLGSALLRRGLAVEAAGVLNDAVKLEAGSLEATFNLAIALEQSGDTVRAVYWYRRFLGLAPLDDPGRAAVEERVLVLEQPHAPAVSAPPPGAGRP